MSDSPIERLLQALERLDADAVAAMMATDGRILTVDGRRAEGVEAVRQLVADFMADLRSASYTVTAQWHVDDVWIAEVESTYELKDQSLTGAIPRAFIVQHSPAGLTDVRVYGARERPLTDHAPGVGGLWIGGRWIPPL